MTYDNTDLNADGVIDSDINTDSLKLGDNWEQTYDADNDRLLIEYTPNGNQFELNEDGTLKPLDGDIDLDGVNSITNASSVDTEALHSESLPTIRVGIENRLDDPVYVVWGPEEEITREPTHAEDAIQAAIDALPDGSNGLEGGHVHINRGNYPIQDGNYEEYAIWVNKDNVRITGGGAATRVYLPDGITADGDGKRIIHVGGSSRTHSSSDDTAYDNFALENILIDGNQQNNRPISNANDGHNIQIQGANWRVEGVWSVNSTGDGIEPMSRSTTTVNGETIPQTHHGTIANCHFLNNYEQNVHIHGGAYINVENNIGNGEVNNSCVHLYSHNTDVHDIKFINNVWANSSQHGMELSSTDTGATGYKAYDIWVIGDTIKSNDRNGVKIDGRGAHDINIVDSDITYNGEAGVKAQFGLDGLSVDGGKIAYNGSNGVSLAAGTDNNGVGTGYLDNIDVETRIIENNQDDGFFYGVQITADGFDVRNVQIEGEIIGDGSGTAGAHKAPFNFLETSTGGTYTNIEVKNVTTRGNQNTGFQNLNFVLAQCRDNTPAIPINVINDLEAVDGGKAYHDGTDGASTNPRGPAFYDSGQSAPVSLVDGTAIS